MGIFNPKGAARLGAKKFFNLNKKNAIPLNKAISEFAKHIEENKGRGLTTKELVEEFSNELIHGESKERTEQQKGEKKEYEETPEL